MHLVEAQESGSSAKTVTAHSKNKKFCSVTYNVAILCAIRHFYCQCFVFFYAINSVGVKPHSRIVFFPPRIHIDCDEAMHCCYTFESIRVEGHTRHAHWSTQCIFQFVTNHLHWIGYWVNMFGEGKRKHDAATYFSNNLEISVISILWSVSNSVAVSLRRKCMVMVWHEDMWSSLRIYSQILIWFYYDLFIFDFIYMSF